MSQLLRSAVLGVAVLSGTLTVGQPGWAETAAPAGDYKIDPDHSSIEFVVSHLGISEAAGRFNRFSGDIHLQPNGDSRVEVTIETDSVDSNQTKRDAHLRSPDFLNVKQYPTMHFVSRRVSYNGEGEPISVDGDLTLHGETRPVTLAVRPIGAGKDPWGGYRAGYTATTTVKRSEFGMNFMIGGVGDEIAITLRIEAIKQ